MNKSERQRGRMTERKLKLAGGDHRLAQVFIRPEVFSIHMKGLKIRALLSEVHIDPAKTMRLCNKDDAGDVKGVDWILPYLFAVQLHNVRLHDVIVT